LHENVNALFVGDADGLSRRPGFAGQEHVLNAVETAQPFVQVACAHRIVHAIDEHLVGAWIRLEAQRPLQVATGTGDEVRHLDRLVAP
jgi:hypothetical protein